MKKLNCALILALIVIMAVLAGSFSSCNTGTAETETDASYVINVKVVYGDEVIVDYPATLHYLADGEPTVIKAVARVLSAFEVPYTLSEDEMSLYSVGEYAETDTGFWAWQVNGKEQEEGKAGMYVLKDGDSVYYYFDEIEVTT